MNTAGSWVVKHDCYIIPAEHADRPIGAAADPIEDRARFAHVICTMAHRYGVDADKARLIAAAPELLARADDMIECLEEMAERGDLPGSMPARVRKLRAAIAKATGSAS